MRWWAARAMAFMRLQLRGEKLGWIRYELGLCDNHSCYSSSPFSRFSILSFLMPLFFSLSLSLSFSYALVLPSLMRVRATKIRQIVFRIVNETTQFNLHRQMKYFYQRSASVCIVYDEFGIRECLQKYWIFILIYNNYSFFYWIIHNYTVLYIWNEFDNCFWIEDDRSFTIVQYNITVLGIMHVFYHVIDLTVTYLVIRVKIASYFKASLNDASWINSNINDIDIHIDNFKYFYDKIILIIS